MSTPLQTDNDGARYEPMPGDREAGDNDGDLKYHIGEVLTPAQIEALFPDQAKEQPDPPEKR